MGFKLILILTALLLAIATTAPAQLEDSLMMQLESQYQDIPDSLVDAFLEMAYGKLNPGIEKILADSGAFNSTKEKTGQWNEYFYKPCVLCEHEKINYNSILKDNDESLGNITFLKETGEYKNGKRQRTWRTYSSERLDKPFDWRLDSEVNYLNNNKEGWERKYLYSNDSSRYEYRRIFYQNGMANGPVYGFNAEGDTTIIGQNKNGLEHGLFKFKKDDIVSFDFDRIYENGVEVETIFFHPNGVVAARGLTIDFQPHGLYKTFNESGQLVMEQTFDHGILEGQSRLYHADGKLKAIIEFSDNKANGNHKYYHSNGRLWTEVEMNSGKPWTIISNYDKNGRTKDKGNLKNGNGVMNRYDEDGKLIARDHYKNGELIKEVVVK